jgi:hypothetical protein
LKTMLVHNLEEAVASWKASKSSGWLPDGCIMGILLVQSELAPLCASLWVGPLLRIFPEGDHLLYLLHPHLGGFQSCDGYF